MARAHTFGSTLRLRNTHITWWYCFASVDNDLPHDIQPYAHRVRTNKPTITTISAPHFDCVCARTHSRLLLKTCVSVNNLSPIIKMHAA